MHRGKLSDYCFTGGMGNGGEAVSPDGETRLQSKCAFPAKLDLDIKQNIVILSKRRIFVLV